VTRRTYGHGGSTTESTQGVTICSWPSRKTSFPFDGVPISGSSCCVYTAGGRDANNRLYMGKEPTGAGQSCWDGRAMNFDDGSLGLPIQNNHTVVITEQFCSPCGL
jgi:hypothetical protein